MEILVKTLLDYFKQRSFVLKPKESYHRLLYVLFFSDLAILRFFLCQASLFVSLFLFFPGNSLERPVYHLMSLFFTEKVWAILFLVHSLSSFISQFVLRKACIFGFIFEGMLGCILWNMMAFCMLFSIIPPPIISGEFCVAISSWLLLARYEPFSEQKIVHLNKKGSWNLLNWYK